MKINVSIADDHIIVLTGLERILSESVEVALLDMALNGDELLKVLKLRQPDVLLLDIQMPGRQGDALAKIIKENYPQIAILVLTNMDQAFHVRNMLLNGVNGYLLKSAGQKTLIEAIITVYKGGQYIDVALREQVNFEIPGSRRVRESHLLTQRELNILELVAEEMTNTQISAKLYLSLSTVETHRNNLFFKLGVKNAAGLVRKALQLGLIK